MVICTNNTLNKQFLRTTAMGMLLSVIVDKFHVLGLLFEKSVLYINIAMFVFVDMDWMRNITLMSLLEDNQRNYCRVHILLPTVHGVWSCIICYIATRTSTNCIRCVVLYHLLYCYKKVHQLYTVCGLVSFVILLQESPPTVYGVWSCIICYIATRKSTNCTRCVVLYHLCV